MTKWHRSFNVDECCSEVDESPLPEKPTVERLTTASEVLEKAKNLFNLDPKLSGALATIADKTLAGEAEKYVTKSINGKLK